MQHEDRVFIWPTHLEIGFDPTGRTDPLTGFFAVKFGKGHAERALYVRQQGGLWIVSLDGYWLAQPSENWKAAFGDVWERGQEHGNGLLIGRMLSRDQYLALAAAREADALRGVDLDAAVNPNTITPPTF